MSRHLPGQESQGGNCTLARVAQRKPPSFLTNTKRRQAETGGCDTGNYAVIWRTYIASVFDQACDWIGLVPKEQGAGLFQILQKSAVFRGKAGGIREAGGAGEP